MKPVFYGRFIQYTPNQLPEGMPPEMASRVLWLKNEANEDLYELRHKMPKDHQFITIEDDNRVRVVHSDPHHVWPMNARLYSIPNAGLQEMNPSFRYFNTETGEITIREPAEVIIYSKKAIFDQLTDAEYDKWELAETKQSKRKRRVFLEAQQLSPADPSWPEVLGLMEATLGKERTATILAKSRI